MDVTIKVIPHAEQRYPTVGDWQFDRSGNLRITVSAMSDHRYETLIAAHELVEAVLCRQAGITTAVVDHFDREFEKSRAEGDESEPGDDPRAPYHPQHVAATEIEKLLAQRLGVDWDAYDKEVRSK